MIWRITPVVFAVLVALSLPGCSGKKLTPEEVAAAIQELESGMDSSDPLKRFRQELVGHVLENKNEESVYSDIRKPVFKIVTTDEPVNERLEEASRLIGERAIEGLESRAKKGDSWAMVYLGFTYYTQYSKNRAVTDFEGLDLPEEARPAWSIARTAIMLGAGEEEPESAGDWFKRAVRKKNARAMAMLGAMYANGHEFDQDAKDARKWYERSAEAGDAVGKTLLGYLLVSEDPDRAKTLMTEAAQSGNAYSMYALAYAHRNGTFGQKDLQSWGTWIGKAKDTAHMESAIEVLVHGMPFSYQEFRNNEGMDSVRDQLSLTHTLDDYYYQMGDSWFLGDGAVQRDFLKALEFYRAAYDLGHSEAAYQLGYAYEKGYGVDRNRERSMEFYEEGARRGSARAAGVLLFQAEEGDKEAKSVVKKLKKEDVDFALDTIEKLVEWKREQKEKGAKEPKLADAPKSGGKFDDPKLEQEYRRAQEFLKLQEEKLAKREEELKEKLKGVNAEIASITGGTPVFGSAKEWHKAYTSAPGISDAEFMRKLPPVSISVLTNELLRQEIDPRVLQKAIMETAGKHGVRFADSSPIRFQVLLSLSGAKLSKDSSEYVREQKISAYNVLVNASFNLNTVVQRGDTFQRLEVSPASQVRIISHRDEGNKSVSQDKIVEYVEQGIDLILKSLKEIDVENSSSQEAWVKGLWSEGDAAKMFDRYQAASRQSGEELLKPLRGVTSLRPAYIEIDNPSNRDRLSSGTLSRYWDREMKEHGFRIDKDSDVGIWHQVYAVWHGWEGLGGFLLQRDVDQNYSFVSKTRFFQVDTVFPLGNELVRKTVTMDARFDSEVTFLERGLLEKFALKQVNKQFGNLDFLR